MLKGPIFDVQRHLFPLAADLGSLFLYAWVLPRLTQRLQEKTIWNWVLFVGVYGIFCFSVYLIRSMDGGSRSDDQTLRAVFAFLAVGFCVFFSVMMADSAGILERVDALGPTLDTVGKNVGVMIAVLLWLVFVFLYPALVFMEIEPSFVRTGLQAHILRFVSLFGVNLMIVFSVAHWEVFFADAEPAEGLALGGKILLFTVVFAFFLLFYASPRLLYLTRNPSLVSALSFLLHTGYYVWRLMDGKAWQN